MIGNIVIGKDGKPLNGAGNKLNPSAYQPSDEVKKLFGKCQQDYQRAYNLQHRPFREFDGLSLLQRAKLDQETFGAYVGAEWVPSNKRWRWKGRKHTARNKLITILAQIIAGMLYPLVHAQNEEDEPDKLSAQVMRIIVENHLKKAGYEMQFLYMVLSALVNPAVFVEVAYYEAYQRIKEKMDDGSYKVTEVVDEFLTGLNLNILQVDQVLLGDFYTNQIQLQPFIIKIRRIAYDTARSIYAGKHFYEGKDMFDFVEAGKTRVFMAGNEMQMLYDIEWTEGDGDAVQEVTFQYRPDDMEVTFLGGVLMGNYTDVYNSNRFAHRRMSLIGNEWKSIPIYDLAKTYFEPIDPTGRFAYGKSAAFKEYWDDQGVNHDYRLLRDGMTLEVIKPLFISGISKVDDIVIAPGAVVGMPEKSSISPWSMSPNLAAAMQVLQKDETDISASTQINPAPNTPTPNVTAAQTIAATNQASRQLTVIGLMIADLIKQVGELTVDCTIQNTLQGEIDTTVPEALAIRYKMILAKTKDKGREITNRIAFKSDLIGKEMTHTQKEDYEWKLWEDKGGDDQVVYHVNPYKFARTMYTMTVDADQIVNHAMGNDRQVKLLKYQMLTQQGVYPYVDAKALADDVIEEFSDGDPDRLKSKNTQGGANAMMQAVAGQGGQPTPPIASPMQSQPLQALTQ